MAYDNHKNLAVSLVATAPSPALSGLTLTVTTGQGSRFPTGNFPVSIGPAGTSPDPSNTEIAYCSSRSGDILTITRAQEGSSARTIVVGDQVWAGITAKTVTDIETAIPTTGQLYAMVRGAAISV